MKGRVEIGRTLAMRLRDHERRNSLPGIADPRERHCFIEQLIDSVRRVQYPIVIRQRRIAQLRADPMNSAFDPIKAAVMHANQGDVEEAFWLVFLFVQFGKNRKSGYRLLRDIYSGGHTGQYWTFNRISSNLSEFSSWFAEQTAAWKSDDSQRGFGAHRGRERLATVCKTIESYVKWVSPPRSHVQLIAQAYDRGAHDPGAAFDVLYKDMQVYRFGRLAKFDYLTMLGKLGLADIEPPSTYILDATGPLAGARLLYCGNKSDRARDGELNDLLVELGRDLCVGQQVVEDALCNWQKSPSAFRAFRG